MDRQNASKKPLSRYDVVKSLRLQWLNDEAAEISIDEILMSAYDAGYAAGVRDERSSK